MIMDETFGAISEILMTMNTTTEEPRPDFDTLWDYQNPVETEQKFRALLGDAQEGDLSHYLQLLTQIARSLSL